MKYWQIPQISDNFSGIAGMEFKFEIHDITLVAEEYVKFLGVNLYTNLNYDTYIQHICK